MEKELYLTFDIDWASDEVIQDLIDLLEHYNVKATFFVTHESAVIKKIRLHSLIELGIHPNFNNLLNHSRPEIDAVSILDEMKRIVPEAVSVRSHSLFSNSRLINEFVSRGYKYDLNMFIPSWSKIECKAYKEVNGIVRMPYFWEDDIHAYAIKQNVEQNWSVDKYLQIKGLKVFDFHPIHVFLNTEDLVRYDGCRSVLKNFLQLKQHCNDYSNPGTRFFLLSLIEKGKYEGFEFKKISEVNY